MALGVILAVAAAGTGCPTLQLTPTRAGFGNALQALYKAYDLAGHCGLRLELVESPLDREVVSGEVVSGRGRAGDRYRRICARLSCAGSGGESGEPFSRRRRRQLTGGLLLRS